MSLMLTVQLSALAGIIIGCPLVIALGVRIFGELKCSIIGLNNYYV